ncbi:MAG: hypothetical protein KDK65_01660, partial [Chlamydiia bacterium]|nr:hypothetical protein [Chlamydiia bacterium]
GVTGKNDIMKDHFFRLMNILKSRKSDNEIFSEDFLLKREINRIFCEIDDKLNIKLVELNKG